LIIFVHVDDMTLITTSEALMGELKTNLHKLFELLDGGAISWMLGIEIQFDAATRSLLLSQQTYLRSILAQIGLTDVRPLSVPADPHIFLSTDMSPATPQDAEAMRSARSCMPQSLHDTLKPARNAVHLSRTLPVAMKSISLRDAQLLLQ
jgi:hypothetical protein